MDPNPEQEQQLKVVRHLNEEFDLFGSSHGIGKFKDHLGIESFHSSIYLDLEGVKVPLDLYTVGAECPRVNAFTPFNPELGYQIDSDDLQLETRIKKLQRADREQRIDFSKAPIFIHIGTDSFYLHKHGLNTKLKDPLLHLYKFPKEMLDSLRRLRVLVFFPTQHFEARPEEIQLGWGGISFDDFYPIDLGPLPTAKPEAFLGRLKLREGLKLFVPSDFEKLKQIRVKFVLIDKEDGKSM